MDHRGYDFGTDCFKLWECGTIELPAFAGRMVDAANVLVNVEDVYVGGGPGAQKVLSAWIRLAVSLRSAMTTSVTNVNEACDAVMQIAEKYADTDREARDSFRDWRSYEITKHAHDPVRT